MPTEFIELNVKGGLGNQLFGLAAGWAIAAESGLNLLVNGSEIGWRGSNRSRSLELDLFEWNSFPNDIVFRKTRKIPDLGNIGNRIYTRLSESIYSYSKTLERRDSPTDFPLIRKSASAGAILDGNFIDFRWFDMARNYEFPIKFNLVNQDLGQVEALSDAAIHIRLGDFLKYPQIFPIPSPRYYNKALEVLKSHDYDVFTDDIEQANEMYPKLLLNARKIVGPESLSGPETFVLLGSYRKIVTSASTFSSIASWSISARGGSVVCPERMIITEVEDSRPASWTRVSD